MPPIRRNSTPANPPGRRPKIAGVSGQPAQSQHPQTREEEAQQVNPAAPADEQAASAEAKGAAAIPGAETPDAADETADQKTETEVVAQTAAQSHSPVSEWAPPGSDATAPGAVTDPLSGWSPEAGQPVATAPKRSRLSWKLVAVLGVITVALAVFAGVVAWVQPDKVTDKAFIDQQTTTEVTAAAKTIVPKIFSYDYKTIDKHAGEIKGNITPGMLTQYNKYFAPSSSAIKQDKSHVDATIGEGQVGVKSLQGDLAQVELLMNVTSSNDGVAGQSAQVPLVVTMERQGGNWVVSAMHQL